ncbi:MAG: site-2 protease family protein [Clostridiales bacterium]|nr:site-2 protease family protein [Clostridiales bacterium]
MFQQPIEILLSLPAVFLAMSFHEFAHAFTADKLGDDTPRKQGRLTLAPLAHVDWTGLILFALFGYGWAKPVQVNPSNFKNKKAGDILVSLSGPAANFLVALLSLLVSVALMAIDSSAPAMDTILSILNYCIYLNIIFGILNLIPIPPLDGYRILKTLLFRRFTRLFMAYEKIGIFILFAFLLFGLFDLTVSRPALSIYQSFITAGQRILQLLQ